MPLGRRIALTVQLNLDSVPGSFHTEEDAVRQVQWILDEAIKHYYPGVSLYTTPVQDDPNQGLLPLGDWKPKRQNWIRDDYYKLPDLSLKNQQPETD